MTGQFLPAVLRGLKHVLRPGVRANSDGQLLDLFVQSRDQTAFAALLHRHGSLVFNVCQRVLGHEQDAEDAFQATFLILARRAPALDRQNSVAGWLHTVAYHTALRARGIRANRQQRERPIDHDPPSPTSEESFLHPFLDEELHRLPERYRVPLVLCYLEGKTNEEAAQQLGCPIGTVKGRLSRAREKLRDQLARRGVALSAGALAGSVGAAAAAVPARLMATTCRTAYLLLAGEQTLSSASSTVHVLTEGVLKTMQFSKVKIMAACLAVIAIVGIGLGVLGNRALNNSDAAVPNDVNVTKIADKNTDVAKARLKKQTTEKNGLSVNLVARQQTFIEGEDLRFSANFKNVSDKDLRLLFARGWELTIEGDDGRWQVVSLLKRKPQPAVFVFKPGHAQGHEVRIDDYFVYRRSGPKKKPAPPRDRLKPGKYKLRGVMKFIKNDSRGAPFWTGTIKPPPVAFEIVADPIPARLRQVEWGKETNGLVAKFRAVKTVVKPGDLLEFELLVKNVSKKVIGLATLNGRLAHYQWRFHFGDWTWSSPGPSLMGMRLKPGDVESVRCLVASTRDSLTAKQKSLFHAGPFRNVKTGEKTTRLPEGIYRVRAELPRGFDPSLETNVIGVRIALAKPLPAEVDRTWKDAGATVGWMWVHRSGSIHFNTAKKEPGGQIPGFQFGKCRDGVLSKLPDPGLPFGLDLSGSKVTDAGLKELAGLKSLQMLNLGVTQVTDAGLKELAALESLQAVNLSGSKVTDAGLKELRGLNSLQSLNLRGIQVTNAGLKELAGLKRLQTLNLFNTKVTNAGLKELAKLKSLQSLDLGYTKVTGAGLKELAGLKNLQTLNLYKTQVTDAGLKELAELKSLQTLSLFNSKVTDVGLNELAGLKSLRSLYIGGTQMTDAGLKELARLKNLQTLNLFNTKVTGASLKDLAGLKSLQTLSLWNAPVTDAALKGLAGLKSLQTLYLGGTKVTDAGLKEVAGLKSLQSLDLYNTRVTDAGLMELAGLKSLRDLHIQSTQVTKAGIAELRKALPGCRIR